MKTAFFSATLISTSMLLITACSGGDNAAQVEESSLLHHHWNLTAINGTTIAPSIKSDLEIGEHFTINGLAGCNRFFGNVNVTHNRLIAEPFASTRMACSPAEQAIEMAVLDTLGKGATIKNKGTELELVGEQYTLTYTLADWM